MHYKMARIWLMAVWWQPLNLFWRHSTGAEGSLLAKWKPFDVKNGVKTFNFHPHPIFGNLIIHWSKSFHWRTPARSQCLGDFSHLALCSNLLVQHCFSCLCGFIIIVAINFCMAGGIEMHITCVLRFSHCVRKMSRLRRMVPFPPSLGVTNQHTRHQNLLWGAVTSGLIMRRWALGGFSQDLILKGAKICSEAQRWAAFFGEDEHQRRWVKI